jgi:hypothetical protein
MATGIAVLCVDAGSTAEATGLALEMRADGVDVLDASNPRVATATLEREPIDVLVIEPTVGQDWDETLATAAAGDVTVLAFTEGRPTVLERPEVAGYVDKAQPDQFERLADRVLEAVQEEGPDYPLADDEDERAVAADRYGMAPLSARSSLERLCRLAAGSLGVSAALVGLVDRTRYRALAGYGIRDVTQPRRESLCARTFLDPGVTCIPELAGHEFGEFAPDEDHRWYASARLVTPDGYPVGTLSVFDAERSAPLSADGAWRLTAFADEAMEQLELRRLVARPQDPDVYVSSEAELERTGE